MGRSHASRLVVRDIALARRLGWLRAKHMERTEAAKRMLAVRHRLTVSDIDPSVRSDATIFLIGAEADQFTGQQAFDGVAELLDVFELSEPIDGVSTRALKAPNLVHPSAHTFISRGSPVASRACRIACAACYAVRPSSRPAVPVPGRRRH